MGKCTRKVRYGEKAEKCGEDSDETEKKKTNTPTPKSVKSMTHSTIKLTNICQQKFNIHQTDLKKACKTNVNTVPNKKHC
jgi:hypothetical protein